MKQKYNQKDLCNVRKQNAPDVDGNGALETTAQYKVHLARDKSDVTVNLYDQKSDVYLHIRKNDDACGKRARIMCLKFIVC